ncbi:MAG: polysaccharide pyruvyl transferase family protein [Chthoniobacteraceae bacterium]
MRITLNGYYGFANYGDELFNLTTVLAARRWWSGHDIDLLGPPVHGIDAKYRVPGWFPTGLYTAPGFMGKASRLGFLAGAMLRRNLLLYAGGSTLSYGSIMKRIQRVAAERGVTKFAAIGVSIGPFADEADEAEAARLLRKFIYFSVRDRKSVELLEKMRVPVKPLLARDLVGALPLLLPEGGTRCPEGGADARPVLGVSVCHYERLMGGDTAAEDRRNAALCEGLERFVKRERPLVRIFCLNTHPRWGDEAFSRELEGRLVGQGAQVEVISARNNLLGCWHGLAACRAVFSVRLHGAITAYLCGVPFALVEYHRKCTDLVEDIGQPESLRLGPAFTDPALVEQVLERLFREPGRPALAPEKYADEAALNFTQVPWATAAG